MKAVRVALLALCLATTGCTSVRVMTPGATPTSERQAPRAGDRVKILLKSGAQRELTISALDAQTLTGVEGKGKNATTVQIAMADVQLVEYRRTNGLRTTGLVLLVTAAVVAATPLGRYLFKCVTREYCGEED